MQILAILAIPVGLTLYLGTAYLLPKIYTFVLCATALSLSWVSVYKIYKKLDIKMSELDGAIKSEKIKQGYNPNINIQRQKDYDRAEEQITN